MEFAFVGPLVVLLLAAATDYSLAIFARQEIHSAARAGMEYAVNRGYDPSGIKISIKKSSGADFGYRFASVTDSGVTIFGPKCACFGQITAGVDPAPATAASTQSCDTTDLVCGAPGETVKLMRMPYVKITVTGTYDPFFPLLWYGLKNGKLELSASYVGKTFFVR